MILQEQKESHSHPLMRLAKKESQKSKSRFKLGAVLVKGRRVLSKACNINKTHPFLGSGPFGSLHAESMAIYKARRRINLVGSCMYVYRANHNLAKPCSECMLILERYGIKKVVYSI